MSEFPFHFAQPGWGTGLWIWLLVVLGLVVFERRGSDAVDRLVGVALQDRLVDRPASWRRWARVVFLSLAGVFMLVALMQPQWGMRFVATPRVGAEIMIALDVSRSMLADDAKPTRLDRAKAEVSDLLAYLKDDYVGLIAFAGRASVLSPMTPDKSFLRLALDSAGPHSVSRGGTRLAEPIRRAVAGMGEPGPAQRALILITDGEDHDSFALDAAKAAAEAGIKIIAIGFGDEGGSEIYVRDRKTGARSLVRDGDGNPVVSRLDGDLLRELALATDGAFVPAGTGVLDLASIYDAHISRLTRGQLDEQGRTIRDEVYQVFVLLALLCLFAAVSVASGRGDAPPARSESGAKKSRYEEMVQQSSLLAFFSSVILASLLGGLLVAAAPLSASAQAAGSVNPTPPQAASAGEDVARGEEDPRVRFNRGNELLEGGNAESATSTFRTARRDAVDDLELRYAATYNLGLAASARAEALRAEDPAAALDALYEAADWFREASGMRPEDRDPRHNLDVTLKKALILADEIASQDQQGVEAALDKLIDDQRNRVGEAAGLLEEIVRSGELDAAEMLRPVFRQAATAQRLIVSDAHALADRIERERETLLRVAEEERTPEDALRIEQLEGVLVYVDSSIERMGQTRRQLRQRRAERAYRRGARALSELKRARDQLRSPVEQIGVLLGEVAQVAQATAALSATGVAGAQPDSEGQKPLPAFLTPEWNEAESAAVQTRVEELAERLGSAAERAAAAVAAGAGAGLGMPGSPGSSPPGGPAGQAPPDPAEQEALRKALVESAPLVAGAGESLAQATEKIAAARFSEALGAESRAGEALAEAQERFFDLRQLLDATYSDEDRIASLANDVESGAEEARSELAPLAAGLQGKNLARAGRLQDLLSREETKRMAALEAQATEAGGGAPANPSDPDAVDPAESERQRFELAGQLLALAEGAMLETRAALGSGAELGEGEAEPTWPAVGEAAARSASHLDAIRTLFFTLAEHVRKLALDQLDLQDRTQDALALANASPSDETKGRADALAPEQRVLETRGGAIADALFAQAESMPDEEGVVPDPHREADEAGEDAEAEAVDSTVPAPAPAPAPSGTPSPQPQPEPESEGDRIRRAADHVALAQLAMNAAGSALEVEVKDIEPIQEEQARAVEELQKALALLSPPPPPQEEEQDQDQESGQDGESEPEESEQEQSPQEQSEAPQPEPQAGEDAEEEMGDPSQLLQGVRDREAERRRDQEQDEMQRRSVPVEKDW